MRLIECEQGTEEWLQARCGVPSASMYSRIVTTKGEWSKSAQGYIDQLIMEKLLDSLPSSSRMNGCCEGQS
jgi:hypothetical protein